MKTPKQLFLMSALTLLSITTLIGQEKLTYSEVVQIDSISQNEIYNRAKLWFATTYNSANNVLQIDNKEEGQLIGKAVIKYDSKVFVGSAITDGYISYIIKIFVKDSTYKYEITDFIHAPTGDAVAGKSSMGLITTSEECPNPKPMQKGWSNKVWKDIKSQIETNMNSLIPSMKQGIKKQTETKKSDW